MMAIGRPNVGHDYYHGEPRIEEPQMNSPDDEFESWCREHDPHMSDYELSILEIRIDER